MMGIWEDICALLPAAVCDCFLQSQGIAFLSICICLQARMACLQGSIDQVDGLLRFETDAEGLMQWDEQIGLVCNRLTTILETAAAKGLLVEA